jgi:hypothetical protein
METALRDAPQMYNVGPTLPLVGQPPKPESEKAPPTPEVEFTLEELVDSKDHLTDFFLTTKVAMPLFRHLRTVYYDLEDKITAKKAEPSTLDASGIPYSPERQTPIASGEVMEKLEKEERIVKAKQTLEILKTIKRSIVYYSGETCVENGLCTSEQVVEARREFDAAGIDLRDNLVDQKEYDAQVETLNEEVVQYFIPDDKEDLVRMKGLMEHDFKYLFNFRTGAGSWLVTDLADSPTILGDIMGDLDTLESIFYQLSVVSGEDALIYKDIPTPDPADFFKLSTLHKSFAANNRPRVNILTGSNPSVKSVDAWMSARTKLLNVLGYDAFDDNSGGKLDKVKEMGLTWLDVQTDPDTGRDIITIYDDLPDLPTYTKEQMEFYNYLGGGNPKKPVGNVSGLLQVSFRLGNLGFPPAEVKMMTEEEIQAILPRLTFGTVERSARASDEDYARQLARVTGRTPKKYIRFTI